MPKLLPMLRVLAPITATISVIMVIALNPHSATFAFWLTLPVNAAGWPVLRAAEQTAEVQLS